MECGSLGPWRERLEALGYDVLTPEQSWEEAPPAAKTPSSTDADEFLAGSWDGLGRSCGLRALCVFAFRWSSFDPAATTRTCHRPSGEASDDGASRDNAHRATILECCCKLSEQGHSSILEAHAINGKQPQFCDMMEV